MSCCQSSSVDHFRYGAAKRKAEEKTPINAPLPLCCRRPRTRRRHGVGHEMRMASGDALRLTIPTQVCLPTFEHLQQTRQGRQPPQMSQQSPRSRWISEIHQKTPSEPSPLFPKISFSLA